MLHIPFTTICYHAHLGSQAKASSLRCYLLRPYVLKAVLDALHIMDNIDAQFEPDPHRVLMLTRFHEVEGALALIKTSPGNAEMLVLANALRVRRCCCLWVLN